MKEKVVLAYSGGLDTSCILKWLIDKNYDVIAFIADIGQNEDLEAAKQKALNCGASKVYIEDLKEEFVTNYIFPAVKANALYESRYLLGTSLARPLIAKKQMEVAKKENAQYVSHGATGKGNDQVRFELTYFTMNPSIKVIAPWKNAEFLAKFKGRTDLIAYAKEKGIPIKATLEKPYSTDENLMHISYESGILEDPNLAPTEDLFEWSKSPQEAPNVETKLEIEFEKGVPVKVNNISNSEAIEGPLEIIQYLNKVGSENAIGRIDIVENRFVGIKSRGVYETPAVTILRAAHLDLEGITMDREVMRVRDYFSSKFADLAYNGFWFSPEMQLIMHAIEKSQEYTTGKVVLTLYKGNITVKGRSSPYSLYNQDLSSMDTPGGFNQQDSIGFIKINSIRLVASIIREKKGV